MNVSQPFYAHEPDSRIMMEKDKVEISGWTEHLEFINEELDYLMDIEDRMLNNSQLYQQLQELQRENRSHIGKLYKYKMNIGNIIECDTAECDAFYLHKHEASRKLYLEHVKKYRNIKTQVLSQILLHAKS
ncbi:hypothetical protein SAMN05421766_104760 [Zobellia uliginosa]|uniref:Uncharacterized protein n=1 Tax=Zobellia uliginosa TaxID=143224 RepID=A0ABY1KYF3_9FLAO|nr:hypothetical protein [Zobellia uliginosa]SIS90229.1 hypothetical protein SAMN05421766_104760 [Zobellia uliginosa]